MMRTVNSQHRRSKPGLSPPRYHLSPLSILAAAAFFIFLPQGSAQSTATNLAVGVLKKLSLEELMDIEVTSVSKHREKWFDSPSALQVITREDIHRSGATRLPEALRLASNLAVAQIDPSQG